MINYIKVLWGGVVGGMAQQTISKCGGSVGGVAQQLRALDSIPITHLIAYNFPQLQYQRTPNHLLAFLSTSIPAINRHSCKQNTYTHTHTHIHKSDRITVIVLQIAGNFPQNFAVRARLRGGIGEVAY